MIISKKYTGRERKHMEKYTTHVKVHNTKIIHPLLDSIIISIHSSDSTAFGMPVALTSN